MRRIYARQLLELAARRRCFVLLGRRVASGVYVIYTFYKFYDENFGPSFAKATEGRQDWDSGMRGRAARAPNAGYRS
jgi:hypothetical protein